MKIMTPSGGRTQAGAERKNKMKIKEYRKSMNLTQKEFSELFNPPIPIDTIKKWDSGKMQPPAWVESLIIEKLERIKSE